MTFTHRGGKERMAEEKPPKKHTSVWKPVLLFPFWDIWENPSPPIYLHIPYYHIY